MIKPEHIRAAIIGYWRQGAKVDEIASIMGLRDYSVLAFIGGYFKNEKLW